MQFTTGFAAQLIALAIIVEVVTQFVKEAIPESLIILSDIQKQLLSLGVALVVAFSTGISLFVGDYAILGTLFAALIASRGSNFTHELIGILEFIRENLATREEIQQEELEIMQIKKAREEEELRIITQISKK